MAGRQEMIPQIALLTHFIYQSVAGRQDTIILAAHLTRFIE